MDNAVRYGFRPVKSLFGDNLIIERGIVATSQSFDVNGGAANVYLRKGDPVVRLSTGGFGLCDGAEGAGGAIAPYGVVAWIGPYWDGNAMVDSWRLPSDTAWGTNLERQSTIGVIPVRMAYFEIDCDDATTATTKAAYQAFLGENCDIRLNGASGESYATPRLDISAHNTTATLIWRIREISGTADNRDFSGNYVKLIVTANVWQDSDVVALGI